MADRDDDESETDDTLCLNGIDATTGQYLMTPMSLLDAAAIIRGTPAPGAVLPELEAPKPDPAEAKWLRRIWRILTQPHLGLPVGVHPEVVAEAGWGIVFHQDESDAVKKALEPLVEHRRTQVPAARCHVLTYKTGQTRESWLGAHKVGIGSVLPERVPYYLLLVGGPERFPFAFCHQLDVEYAVGCVELDSPADYERYARSVVDYETSATVPNARSAVYFGTRHPYDAVTQLSADQLIAPLAARPPATFAAATLLGEAARKQALIDVLVPRNRQKPPAILFTASHGMGWKTPDDRQRREQGALICQEWKPFKPPGPTDYLAASDVPADARVHGLMAFHFACYGAGTPLYDRFLHRRGQKPPAIAHSSFIAALPKTLLAHPAGSALAVIGHVERAWGCSIGTRLTGAQLLPFQNTLDRIALGQPVGFAVKDFNERYASLSTSLTSLLEQLDLGAAIDDKQLARAWVERNDAEGYLVLGDPAVALRVDKLI